MVGFPPNLHPKMITIFGRKKPMVVLWKPTIFRKHPCNILNMFLFVSGIFWVYIIEMGFFWGMPFPMIFFRAFLGFVKMEFFGIIAWILLNSQSNQQKNMAQAIGMRFQCVLAPGVMESRSFIFARPRRQEGPKKKRTCLLKREHFKRKGLSSNHFSGKSVGFQGSTSWNRISSIMSKRKTQSVPQSKPPPPTNKKDQKKDKESRPSRKLSHIPSMGWTQKNAGL